MPKVGKAVSHTLDLKNFVSLRTGYAGAEVAASNSETVFAGISRRKSKISISNSLLSLE